MKGKRQMLYFAIMALVILWGIIICVGLNIELKDTKRDYEAKLEVLMRKDGVESYEFGYANTVTEAMIHITRRGMAHEFRFNYSHADFFDDLYALCKEESIKEPEGISTTEWRLK